MWAGFFSYGLTGHTEVLWAASFKQKFYISGFTGPFVDENFIVALTYCGEKLFLYYVFSVEKLLLKQLLYQLLSNTGLYSKMSKKGIKTEWGICVKENP